MARYFKIVEIDADEFNKATDEDLDYCQLVVPTDEAVFVAVDEYEEYEITIPLECLERQ